MKEIPSAEKIQSIHNISDKMGIAVKKKTLSVNFNKNDFTVAQVIGKIMADIEVTDVQIKETELTDIVKRIYQNGVEAV